MDLQEYTKENASFLKASDVSENPAAVFHILNEGELKENKFGNKRLHLNGEFNGEPKTFDVSSTNARIIASYHGEESKDWIGKSIKLETYKTRTSDGKLVDAIAVAEIQ